MFLPITKKVFSDVGENTNVGGKKYAMIPMTEDTFMFKDLEYFRLKFIRDALGNAIEVNGLYDDGHQDRSKKTN